MGPIVCEGMLATAVKDADVNITVSRSHGKTAEIDTGFEMGVTEAAEGCIYGGNARMLVR